MKKHTLDYCAPESVMVDLCAESGIICSSPKDDGFTIEDYEKEIIGW
jgi:hypothetical protein